MNSASNATLLSEVASYYANKLKTHGGTPLGVDWNGEESQILRFEQLCKVIATRTEGFSLNDLGCGYGALLDFVDTNYSMTSYCGIDISEDMIRAGRSLHVGHPRAQFITAAEPGAVADYGVASGIFNVRLTQSNSAWLEHIGTTLDILNRSSRFGFAFNCLTSYSDADRMQDYLYYADPCVLFSICKQRYSRNVALYHDYNLYEFTIAVRKQRE